MFLALNPGNRGTPGTKILAPLGLRCSAPPRHHLHLPRPRKNGGYHYSSSHLPSGKHEKNYGKSPFLTGKLTINGNVQ